MTRPSRALHLIIASLAVGSAFPALAQDRGLTDGSEIGKGDYSRPGGGTVSIAMDWGTSLAKSRGGSPILLGTTLGYWVDNSFQVELSGGYWFQDKNLELLVGPRLRTAFRPIGASIALKGGTLLVPSKEDSSLHEPHFALSPQASLDLFVSGGLILDLSYAADVDVGERELSHRIFMTVGYRF